MKLNYYLKYLEQISLLKIGLGIELKEKKPNEDKGKNRLKRHFDWNKKFGTQEKISISIRMDSYHKRILSIP